MGRGKIKVELIKNEKARMITYNKRKKGLTKKVEEFKILCDVDACLIILGPNCKNLPNDVETWPSDPNEVRRIIEKYRSQCGEKKKIQDLSNYFETRKKKVEDDIAKMHKACMQARYPSWDNRLNNFQVHQLRGLECELQSKLEVAMNKIMVLKGEHSSMMIGSNNLGTFGNAFDQNQSSSFPSWNQLDPQMIQFNVTNPMLMANNLTLFNNPRAHPIRRQDPPLMLPSVPPHVHLPQFSDFYDFNEFHIPNNKGGFGF